jgi:ribosome-binding ATPase YchF (GTP1/OBG family)
MEIIQTELRLKDIEWVEKTIDGLKKSGRSLGSNSLADKAKKEEIVISFSLSFSLFFSNPTISVGNSRKGPQNPYCGCKGHPKS